MPESRRGATTAPATEMKPVTRTLWPPSDWSVRRKVVACLALPLVFATVLVGIRVAGAWSDAQAASQAKTRYQALEPAIDYLASSQDLATQLVSPNATDKTVGAARAQFQQARGTLRSAMKSADLNGHQSSLLNDAVSTGKNLDTAANATSGSTTLAPGTISSDVLGFLDDLDAVHPDPTLNVLHDLVTAQSHLADQRLELAAGTDFSNALRTQLAADVGGERDALERVQAEHLPAVDVSGLQSDTVSRLAFTTDGTLDQVMSVTRAVTKSYQPAYQSAASEATKRVEKQADDARRSALLQIALILALLILTALAVYFLSRALLVRPIAALRRSTIDASQKHLPAAIERVRTGQGVGRIQSVALSSREEIGQLSRAVDDMQNRAIRLASEQATLRRQMTEMFETLSRRSTSLVNQQLNLLEQLERTEDDPTRLDSLFRLDHMAARMRRNGQSLMVLAGNDAGSGRARPLPLAQVVGAAVSEVQDYQRVNVGGLPDHVVDKEVATDLVHLIAELVDNALAYSPPDSRVEISGARAIDGGVLLEIEDHGLGIDKDELKELNNDITAGGRFGLGTTRHMGLFVVARLSDGHGIDVRLRSRLQRGTIAAVHVPVQALTSELATADEDRTDVYARPEADAVTAPASLVSVGSSSEPSSSAMAESLGASESSAATRESTAAADARDDDVTETTELPRRRPGATGVTSLSGTASLGTRAAAAGVSPTAERNGNWVSPIGTAPTADPERASNASAFFSARRAVATDDRAPQSATTSGLPQRHPRTEAPAASAPSAEQAAVQREEPVRHTPARQEDTPIFQQISSRWLTPDGEPFATWSSGPTDQAWEAAQVATEDHSSEEGALPQRQPGRFIVPGSVEQSGTRPTRDPEELRAKLSRYKAGVERARQSTNDNDTDNGSRPW